MFLVEKASKKLASQIAMILNLDKERQEILAYGALNFMHTILSTLLLVLFGLFTKSLMEIMIISLTSALLRQSSGGSHATSPNRCAIIGSMVFGGLTLSVVYNPFLHTIVQVLAYQTVSFVFILYAILRHAPLDTPNKRIQKKELRDRLRLISLRFLLLLMGLTVILWWVYLHYHWSVILTSIVCINTGMVWQALSLTVLGRSFIKKMDTFLARMHV